MAKRIKSGIKRHRQDEVRRQRNRAVRTRVRNAIKALRTAISDADATRVKELLPKTVSVIDNSVHRGILHHNAAARYKSQLTTQATRVTQAAAKA
jgi:small subunit ribosomal protein S20